jgi:hypothetical protein
MEFDLLRPWLSLDPWQSAYIASPGNNFLLCGRQVGKSTAASIKAVELAVHQFKKGEDILIIAFTESQAFNLFAKCYNYAESRYSKLISKKAKEKPTKHEFTINGVKIICKAAGIMGEGLRGPTIKKIFIDEPRNMNDAVFDAVSPMVSVIGGSIDLLGTPGGKDGFFYQCSNREDFTKFYVSAEDCPRHSKEFLQREKETKSQLVYSQEYLAMFLDDLKRLYTDAWIERVCTRKRPEVIDVSKEYCLGVDVGGEGGDESSFEIFEGFDRENIKQVENIVIKGKSEVTAYDEILSLNLKWKFAGVGIDNRGIGSAVYGFLLRSEVKNIVCPLDNAKKAVNRDKTDFVRLMKEEMYLETLMLGEKGKLHLLQDENLILSLRSVQRDVTEADNGKREFRIFGNYTHIAEGIIRGVYMVRNKPLKFWFR